MLEQQSCIREYFESNKGSNLEVCNKSELQEQERCEKTVKQDHTEATTLNRRQPSDRRVCLAVPFVKKPTFLLMSESRAILEVVDLKAVRCNNLSASRQGRAEVGPLRR